jgi:hypothetical protein
MFAPLRKLFKTEQERTMTILLAYPNSLFVRAKRNKGRQIYQNALFFALFFALRLPLFTHHRMGEY